MNINRTHPCSIFQTAIGSFRWYPNDDALQQHIYLPIRKAIAKAQEDKTSQAHFLVQSWWPLLLTTALQDAVEQACHEMIAVVEATMLEEKRHRAKRLDKAAEQALRSSVRRMRMTHQFPPVEKGEPRRLLSLPEIVEKHLKVETQAKEAIKFILEKDGAKAKPTMGHVAALLGMGCQNTRGGNNTGQKILSKKLGGKEKFKELIKDARRELQAENQ